jgi:hypothetical protein
MITAATMGDGERPEGESDGEVVQAERGAADPDGDGRPEVVQAEREGQDEQRHHD